MRGSPATRRLPPACSRLLASLVVAAAAPAAASAQARPAGWESPLAVSLGRPPRPPLADGLPVRPPPTTRLPTFEAVAVAVAPRPCESRWDWMWPYAQLWRPADAGCGGGGPGRLYSFEPTEPPVAACDPLESAEWRSLPRRACWRNVPLYRIGGDVELGLKIGTATRTGGPGGVAVSPHEWTSGKAIYELVGVYTGLRF